MGEDDFEGLKTLLSEIGTMDIVSLHSYLRGEEIPNVIRLVDIIDGDFEIAEDIIISTNQLLTFVEIEFQKRNLN